VSKIFVDAESSINILYGGTVDRMEDTPEMARAMIISQTWYHLYEFDGNETHSLGTVSFPVRADPNNVIMEFYMIDVKFSQHHPWEVLDPHDEGCPIELPPAPVVPHFDRNRGHMRPCLAPSAQFPGKSRAGCRRLPRRPLTTIPLRGRSKNGLLINSNHRMAKAKTLTPPMSREVQTTSRKRKPNYFM